MKIHFNYRLQSSFLNTVSRSVNNENPFNKGPLKDTFSFGSNGRVTYDDEGRVNRNVTDMFRNDLGCDWEIFAKSLGKNFCEKDKVNVICQACSDGSEPYTLAISLLKYLGEDGAKKFFPIIAKDFDEKILKGPKKGLVNLSKEDIEQFKKRNIDFDKYFEKSEEKLEIDNDFDKSPKETYRAKEILQKNIIFEQGNVFDDLEALNDDSNTVFLFRNAMWYLYPDWDTIDRFLNLVGEKLKPGSVFASGETQLACEPNYIEETLTKKNFKCLYTCESGQRSYGTFVKEEAKPEKSSFFHSLFRHKAS